MSSSDGADQSYPALRIYSPRANVRITSPPAPSTSSISDPSTCRGSRQDRAHVVPSTTFGRGRSGAVWGRSRPFSGKVGPVGEGPPWFWERSRPFSGKVGFWGPDLPHPYWVSWCPGALSPGKVPPLFSNLPQICARPSPESNSEQDPHSGVWDEPGTSAGSTFIGSTKMKVPGRGRKKES